MKHNTRKLKLVLKVTGYEIECFEITELIPCHAYGISFLLCSFFTSENDILCWYITNTKTSVSEVLG